LKITSPWAGIAVLIRPVPTGTVAPALPMRSRGIAVDYFLPLAADRQDLVGIIEPDDFKEEPSSISSRNDSAWQ
jgi:hypothetical protein